MAKLIHSMIRVLNEKRSVEFYRKAFDMEVSRRVGFEDFVLVYLKNENSYFELELTINKGQTENYNLGNGYGHLAFCVDNIKAEHEKFEKLGLEPRKLVDFCNKGEKIAEFFFVKDPDGYEIEVIQKAGHYQ